MVSVFDVAKYILDTIGEISTMKLQKLCYYSQAWSLAWTDKRLIKENFYRWDNGPVCVELFEIHKGMFYINSDYLKEKAQQNLSTEQKRIVDQIIEDYGKYTGAQLSELTHKEDPWLKTEKDKIIPVETIKNFYKNA